MLLAVWGRYDILCMPPSFPYGGMENPCLTFATPTLLAGDRSLANVIAHEIAHSWYAPLLHRTLWTSTAISSPRLLTSRAIGAQDWQPGDESHVGALLVE